ncbi:MAG: phosphatidate cytidylyltransferase [Candidatus Eisenbacteria bacterium]
MTGALLLPVLLFLIHQGGWAFSGFILLVVACASWEWRRMVGLGPGEGAWLALGGLGICLAASRPDAAGTMLLSVAGFVLGTLLLGLRRAGGDSRRRSGDLLLGFLYVGLLPAFLLRMRALPDGRAAVLLTYATVFLCDTCAFAIGRLFGRRPLWSRVSPRKTWEGAVAGLLGAVIAALAGRAWFAGFLGPGQAVGFGAIVGVLGQAGDLVESQWKRETGVKDSSALIPGHGGVLDRFDNLHFVAPILYSYLVCCC